MRVSITNNNEYLQVLNDIKSRIRSARIKATHAVNRELIELYWKIGKIIVEKQSQLGWGKAIVETLSKDIRKEFPGISGYSPDNLWRMRQFYVEYSDIQIMEQLVPELENKPCGLAPTKYGLTGEEKKDFAWHVK